MTQADPFIEKEQAITSGYKAFLAQVREAFNKHCDEVKEIATKKFEATSETDKEGSFETEIDLIDGVNEIIISSFDESANEVSKTLTLVYTETEL